MAWARVAAAEWAHRPIRLAERRWEWLRVPGLAQGQPPRPAPRYALRQERRGPAQPHGLVRLLAPGLAQSSPWAWWRARGKFLWLARLPAQRQVLFRPRVLLRQ